MTALNDAFRSPDGWAAFKDTVWPKHANTYKGDTMPIAVFDFGPEVSSEQCDAIVGATQQAITESVRTPSDDWFQIIHRHGHGELRASPTWGGVSRRQIVYIEILLGAALSGPDTLTALFGAVAERVVGTGVRKDDIFLYSRVVEAWDWS